VEVTVNSGVLTIHAERSEEQPRPHRSEFHYSSFTRSLALADLERITARYDKGILEVVVPVSEASRLTDTSRSQRPARPRRRS
jgi:HSP20 family molecular chaperone IbpA